MFPDYLLPEFAVFLTRTDTLYIILATIFQVVGSPNVARFGWTNWDRRGGNYCKRGRTHGHEILWEGLCIIVSASGTFV
jgi:hypothetical protein